jgi:hypothetical protein
MTTMKTVFYDLVDNVELEFADAQWVYDCISDASKVLHGSDLEEYKRGLFASCLIEEREKASD